jgi:hypothetical protein
MSFLEIMTPYQCEVLEQPSAESNYGRQVQQIDSQLIAHIYDEDSHYS